MLDEPWAHGLRVAHRPEDGFYGPTCERVIDHAAMLQCRDVVAEEYQRWMMELHQRPNLNEQ